MDRFTRTNYVQLGFKIIILLFISINSFGQSVDQYKTAIATGSANTYTIPNSDWGEYRNNEKWLVDFSGVTTNSNASTINRNSLGAKTIKNFDGTDLSSGTLKNRIQLSYNSATGFFYIVGGSGSGGGGGGTWGSITGTLSNQTDLNTALGLKFAISNNLSEGTPSTMRTNLGLGTLATQNGTFSGTSSGTNTGDQTITLTTDVTGSGTGTFATTIASGAVTLAKMANMATSSLIYRKTAGSGVPEVNTLATLKTDLGLTGTNSGDQTITLTGDITGSGTGSFATTLATVNSNVGTFGSATTSLTATVNGKGLITAISSQTVTPAIGSITGLGTGVATWLATPSSANLRGALTDELGTGASLFDGATPTSFVLTNATGLPPTTGISGWPANTSGVLSNNGSGVLSWGAGMTNPMTTTGDIIVGGTSGTPARLAIGSNNTFLWSNGSSLQYNDLPQYVRDNRVIIQPAATMNFYGDSYTVADPGFRYYVITQLNLSQNNYGISGRGYVTGINQAYTNLSPGNVNPANIFLGLNDVDRSSNKTTLDTKTAEKMKSGLRAITAIQWLASGAVAANNAAVTTTGTWTTTSGINGGDYASLKLGGLVRKSVVIGSTLNWTTPVSTTFVLGGFSTDEVTTFQSPFNVSIDGGANVLVDWRNKTDGVGDGLYDNTICGNAYIVTGLSNTTHTIVITTTGTTQTLIDYLGVLQSVAPLAPIIVSGPPKLDATGYAAVTGGSDATMAQAAAALLSVVNEFRQADSPTGTKWPIFFNQPNNYYNVANISGDHLHPGTTGYVQIANSIISLFDIKTDQLGIGQTIVFRDGATDVNRGGFNYTGDRIDMLANGNPIGGAIPNSGYPEALFRIQLASADASFNWYGNATNNALGSQTMKLDKLGNLLIGTTTSTARLFVQGPNQSSAWLPTFQITPGTNTSITASTPKRNGFYIAPQTEQWLVGALSSQAYNEIGSETIGFTSASTATEPTSLLINSPVQGTNANAFVRPSALTLNGNLLLRLTGKILINEGTDGSVGQTTLVSGTKATTVNGVTTASRCFATLVSQGGTVTTTSAYQCACTANTVTITAVTASIATNTTDTSTLNYWIVNQ